MGRGGRRGEQATRIMDNTPWGPVCSLCAAKRHGNEQYQHVSRRISRRRTEEANNY